VFVAWDQVAKTTTTTSNPLHVLTSPRYPCSNRCICAHELTADLTPVPKWLHTHLIPHPDLSKTACVRFTSGQVQSGCASTTHKPKDTRSPATKAPRILYVCSRASLRKVSSCTSTSLVSISKTSVFKSFALLSSRCWLPACNGHRLLKKLFQSMLEILNCRRYMMSWIQLLCCAHSPECPSTQFSPLC
jgi:hypothetical protein